MQVSVIVPVYNMAAGGRLAFCLESLLNQTLSDMEILAVDDASTDESLALLRDYEARYPARIRVIALARNRRQGGARNAGLAEARGEWVSFIDSDDWVSPYFYEKLVARGEETGADMVGCDYQLVHSHTMEPGERVANNHADQTGILDEDKHKSLFMRSGSMVIKIYKRRVIEAHGLRFPEGIFYEDNCAGPLWSLYFGHFERVEEALYYYYQHEGSTVHYISQEKCEDRKKAAATLYEECVRRGFMEAFGPEIRYRVAELYYINTLFSYMQGVKKPRPSFTAELKRGLTDMVPRLEENVYYRQFTGEEEKKWIHMHLQSNLLFFISYRVRRMIRRLRGRKSV